MPPSFWKLRRYSFTPSRGQLASELIETDLHILAISETSANPFTRASLADSNYRETTHLEQWIIDNPAVIGEDVMIVCRQYETWSSKDGDSARQRLDILGLDRSGQLVVVELKRGSDPHIHLQAITYAGLVAGFDKATLAEAHAEFLKNGTETSTEDALLALESHVDDDWDVETLRVPRIVLIAEAYAAQTLTTVTWLAEIAPNLSFEMRTANVFLNEDASDSLGCVVFRRQYPPDDLSTRVLTPGAESAASAVSRIAERKRAARSTYVIYDNNAIPEGAEVELNLDGAVSADLVKQVEDWISEDRTRGLATWTKNREKPLRWNGFLKDSEKTWTPTALAQTIVEEATGQHVSTIPGGDVWFFNEKNLLAIAREISL